MAETSEKIHNEGQVLEKLPIVYSGKAPRPLVKWAGGKGQLLQVLEKYYPENFSTYYEPFLGGGAVFFHLFTKRPPFKAVLSDINEELINTYLVVKEKVDELVKLLRVHKAKYKKGPKKYYYKVRDDQEPSDKVERAARLIFLDKTCYNGLYRVNREGKFNVPFGRYKNPKICDEENLRAVGRVLRLSEAQLLAKDYQEATQNAKKGDFVYFDPPYQPASKTANFTSYTNSGFSFQEQERLCEWFGELHNRGCFVLLSNSDTKAIRELYRNRQYYVQPVSAMRAISCKGSKRTGHKELIISNLRSGFVRIV